MINCFPGPNQIEEVTIPDSGRIESYIHSDNSTPNKGGVLVKICCGSDFGARTQEFIDFCKTTARLCYAIDLSEPGRDYVSRIMEIDSDFTERVKTLEGELKEKIKVTKVIKFVL